jgi:tetratricopeptide (TPR) repeat protein
MKRIKQHLIYFVLLTLTTAINSYGQVNYLQVGNTYLNNNQLDKAERTFRKGIKAEPGNLIYQCQLGLSLIKQEKYNEAEEILNKVLDADSTNIGANWYSGIGAFKSGKDRKAIQHFERALSLLDINSGQYYSANWYIGKSYSILLKTEGLTYKETDRMFECYEEYLRLQPDAKDSEQIREYVDRKKKRRPSENVIKWIDM